MMLHNKTKHKLKVCVILCIVAGSVYGMWGLYQAYLRDKQLEADMAGTYDYQEMVKRYQGYPDSILVKSESPRVAFNEVYQGMGDGYMYISPVYKHDKSELKKPIPTSQDQVTWYRYGFTSDQQKIYFSFDFPEHGIYCEGCFDGWPYNNTPANASGVWITGGYYRDRVITADLPRMWSLTAGIVLRNPKLFYTSYDPDYPNQKLESIDRTVTALMYAKIGERVEIDDPYYEQAKVQAKRLKDIPCGQYMCRHFILSNAEKTEYALLDKGGYVVMFTYEFTDPVFDDFKKILSSYTENIDTTITHGRFPRVNSLEGYEVIPE